MLFHNVCMSKMEITNLIQKKQLNLASQKEALALEQFFSAVSLKIHILQATIVLQDGVYSYDKDARYKQARHLCKLTFTKNSSVLCHKNSLPQSTK